MDINALQQATQNNGSGGSKSALSSINNDFDMFLTLLTTQLRNQDPLDPMDNTEMTNQLVQFAGVEQQIQQNTNLEQLITLQQAGASSAAVAYIGKDVQIEGDTTNYTGQPITFGYTPPEDVESLSVSVVDPEGNLITTFEGETTAQRHTLTWDGTDSNGDPVEHGIYKFLVGAFDEANDSVLMSQKDVTGRVTGSAADENGVYVLLDDVAINLNQVISVRDPQQQT